MPDCGIDISNVPVSATIPAGTDKVLFTLPDGTTVARTWAVIRGTLMADDLDLEVGTSAGAPVEGTYSWSHPALAGRRWRLYRDGRKQTVVGGDDKMKYGYNPANNTVTVNVPWGPLESVQVEFY